MWIDSTLATGSITGTVRDLEGIGILGVELFLYGSSWTPKASGTYRYRVSAKDLAGNGQRVAGSGKVVVR